MVWDVVIVGAGAAGLLAAIRAAECGRRTLVLEKNTRAGVKILMSGGTRCNLTHATDAGGIIAAFGRQGRFLHSALAALDPDDVVQMFEREGVRHQSRAERQGVSDQRSSGRRAERPVAAVGTKRGRVVARANRCCGWRPLADGFDLTTARRQVECPRGDLDHRRHVVPGLRNDGRRLRLGGETGPSDRDAAAGLDADPDGCRMGQAVERGDASRTCPFRCASPRRRPTSRRRPASAGNRLNASAVLAAARGSFLFTHFGLSGPVALDVSRAVSGSPQPQTLELRCDFWPAESADELGRWLDERCRPRGQPANRRLPGGTLASTPAPNSGGLGRGLRCANGLRRHPSGTGSD